jgi:hypothetical protein
MEHREANQAFRYESGLLNITYRSVPLVSQLGSRIPGPLTYAAESVNSKSTLVRARRRQARQ